jgi:hypothetical protein
MKPQISEVQEMLGDDIIQVFEETFGDDRQALAEILDEAMRAMKIVKQDDEYNSLCNRVGQ